MTTKKQNPYANKYLVMTSGMMIMEFGSPVTEEGLEKGIASVHEEYNGDGDIYILKVVRKVKVKKVVYEQENFEC